LLAQRSLGEAGGLETWNLKPRLSKAEWMMLTGVVLIIVSLVGPGLWAYRAHVREARVRHTLHTLMEAGLRFHAEYGTWPSSRTCGYSDCRFGGGIPNREVIRALCATEPPNAGLPPANSHKIIYLETEPFRPGSCGVDDLGDLLDPWGMPFQIVLDSDMSGTCVVDNSIHGTVESGMIAWSCGPDGQSDTRDDIVSWK
jgi:hypothetical protein